MNCEGSEWKPPEINPGMCLDGKWKLKKNFGQDSRVQSREFIHDLPNSMKAYHQFDHDACPQSAGV